MREKFCQQKHLIFSSAKLWRVSIEKNIDHLTMFDYKYGGIHSDMIDNG
jgi:hypothetical protein